MGQMFLFFSPVSAGGEREGHSLLLTTLGPKDGRQSFDDDLETLAWKREF